MLPCPPFAMLCLWLHHWSASAREPLEGDEPHQRGEGVGKVLQGSALRASLS